MISEVKIKYLIFAGSYQEGPVGGALRRTGGGGEKEAGAGLLAGQNGDLAGQDGPRLLSDPRLPSKGTEGEIQNLKKMFFHKEILFSLFTPKFISTNPE